MASRVGRGLRLGHLLTQRFFIPGPLPGLNELLSAKGSGFGKGNGYARLKKEWTDRILMACMASRLKPVQQAEFHFEWMERNKRRDPDNFSSGGRKLILDALVKGGILPGDGWSVVLGFSDDFLIAADVPGVWVTISSSDLATNAGSGPLG